MKSIAFFPFSAIMRTNSSKSESGERTVAKATLTEGLLADRYQKVREHFMKNVSPELHASAYVGVRDKTWAGPEFAGKYLDICSQFYRNVPEAVFLDNAKRVIGSILKEQRPDGDLSAVDFSDAWFWVWNQAFTLYGMLSYYRTTKEEAVLQAAEKCAQGIIDRFSGRGISTVLDTVNDGSEHLVIMLPFSMLYAITGKDCYADFVRYLIRYLETTDMNLVSFTDILQLRSKKGIEMLLAFLGLLHFGVQIGNLDYIAAADRYFRQVYERQIALPATARWSSSGQKRAMRLRISRPRKSPMRPALRSALSNWHWRCLRNSRTAFT